MKFFIDAGATNVALRESDAASIGIHPAYGDYAKIGSKLANSQHCGGRISDSFPKSARHVIPIQVRRLYSNSSDESCHAIGAGLLASSSHLCFLLGLICQSHEIQAVRRLPILIAGS
jgi:hypothetical protein